mmetsp:Transcript_20440/g.40472  ORF Transcript_20440/g.40472 Transcript_20440/m.40472 type:complete len:359 (-) Transcript_20440:180-1256(-)|eukprot:CAMPEP_0175140680 /NCGR_PEP_ID=MMETSP0087-20121206/11657_1 /TAXON_ID=136419 /ORGANISM="Unknown Unknown, Strain D1" /LENGTH=358 /DNA_ID=CAMNT_0016423957 /DNA_START=136 /DNA_END=1212 /DNA_ORIENTATION=-
MERASRSEKGNLWAVQSRIDQLLNQNRKWVEHINTTQPDYFSRRALDHKPEYLWIGCADARVPADQLLGESPGSVFVHRNIANMVLGTDANVMSVLQYAVNVLKVKHIIVCGHYDCGGVNAAMESKDHDSPLEDWLRNIRDVARLHSKELDQLTDRTQRYRRLTELNVVEQTLNIFKTGAVQRRRIATALDPRYEFPVPQIHALVFDTRTGRLQELDVNWTGIFQEWQHLYSLYHSKGRLPLPPSDPSMLQDMYEEVLASTATYNKMKGLFDKYSTNGHMSLKQLGRFIANELHFSSTEDEQEQAFRILSKSDGDDAVDSITFHDLIAWWRALEVAAAAKSFAEKPARAAVVKKTATD